LLARAKCWTATPLKQSGPSFDFGGNNRTAASGHANCFRERSRVLPDCTLIRLAHCMSEWPASLACETRSTYISRGRLVSQCPEAFAATTRPRKMQARAAATTMGEAARRRHLSAGVAAFLGSNENCRAFSAGHAATHAIPSGLLCDRVRFFRAVGLRPTSYETAATTSLGLQSEIAGCYRSWRNVNLRQVFGRTVGDLACALRRTLVADRSHEG
jgi:hypothetical protein